MQKKTKKKKKKKKKYPRASSATASCVRPEIETATLDAGK